MNQWANLVILIFSTCYFSWWIFGLRYTNYDDIYFNLMANIFTGDYLNFADNVAVKQGRLQAYLNMPIVLGVHSVAETKFYDVINIGSILAVFTSLIYFLGKVGRLRDAMALITVSLLLFPLHYYFTFPQGYPLMFSWGLCFGLLSAGLLWSYLQQRNNWKITVSVILFMSSLWGAEYNFLLHPILLCIPFFHHVHGPHRQHGLHLVKFAFPYFLGWLLCLGAYFVFNFGRRGTGEDVVGRLVPSFDFVAWIKSLLILEEKSFLPASLWRGVNLPTAGAQGIPDIPNNLNYVSLLQASQNFTSLTIIFILMWIFLGSALYLQQFSKKTIFSYSAIFLSFTLIPCAVLAASSHYQEILLAGHIQGHPATFYAQLGITCLVFLLLSAACNSSKNKSRRKIYVVIFSSLLAWVGMVTFVYNYVNSAYFGPS